MDERKFCSPRFAMFSILVLIMVLLLRGDLYYLFCLPSALLLLAGLLLQLLTLPLSAFIFDRLSNRFPPPRLMWLIPLFVFAIQLGFLLLLLIGPHWAGVEDFWPEVFSLPTRFIARLAIDCFILMAVSTLGQFAFLVRHAMSKAVLAQARENKPRDFLTSMALFAGSVIVFGLLIHWHLGIPDNLLFCRALVALNVEGKPRRSLELFNEMLTKYPDSHLVDSALLRSGRIHQEILGDGRAATAIYRRLQQDCVSSSWRDDAAYRIIALNLNTANGEGYLIKSLEQFLVDFPTSCYADDALYHLVRLNCQLSNRKKAEQFLKRLEDDYPWGRMFLEEGKHYPWNVKNTAKFARTLIEKVH